MSKLEDLKKKAKSIGDNQNSMDTRNNKIISDLFNEVLDNIDVISPNPVSESDRDHPQSILVDGVKIDGLGGNVEEENDGNFITTSPGLVRIRFLNVPSSGGELRLKLKSSEGETFTDAIPFYTVAAGGDDLVQWGILNWDDGGGVGQVNTTQTSPSADVDSYRLNFVNFANFDGADYRGKAMDLVFNSPFSIDWTYVVIL